jgi:GNAT superfamily N-acetyltransferase
VFLDLDPSHDALLERFYRGIYWDAFAAQHEPLDNWRAGLRGEVPYALTIRLALDGETILGGIVFEHYPRSGCGFVTYMVVAPSARGAGLGRQLQTEAASELFAGGAPAVFGELNDPRVPHAEGEAVAWTRLERNQRWGARVLAARYVQPALGPGLQRDRNLVMIAIAGATPLPATLPGAIARDFIAELYAVTEGGAPDPDIAIPDQVPLVELHR